MESSKESAPAMAAKALDQELGVSSATPVAPTQVNDLTSMVKKKKKPVVEANNDPPVDASCSTKRKAEDEALVASSEKKPKLDEAPAAA